MTEQEIIDRLNTSAPKFIRLLGGKVLELGLETGTLVFEFNVSTDFCHSVDVVQGGFVTAMLDASMAHLVMGQIEDVVGLASLEVNTKYLDVTRAGRLRAEARAIKLSHKTAFLEAALFDENGTKTAIANSVSKLARRKA